jgi:Coenzyme PQQ synthesis protein D (PqqD)
MSDSSSFKINTASISHETIDGEVVMVNLNNGSYYSMDKTGAVIWNYIDMGMSIKQITEQIKNQYSGESSEIETSINELIIELQKEELILLSDSTNGKQTDSNNVSGNLETEKKDFEKPVLQKFTDMQDLLMLDPIHDLDEMGSPKKSTKPKE